MQKILYFMKYYILYIYKIHYSDDSYFLFLFYVLGNLGGFAPLEPRLQGTSWPFAPKISKPTEGQYYSDLEYLITLRWRLSIFNDLTPVQPCHLLQTGHEKQPVIQSRKKRHFFSLCFCSPISFALNKKNFNQCKTSKENPESNVIMLQKTV